MSWRPSSYYEAMRSSSHDGGSWVTPKAQHLKAGILVRVHWPRDDSGKVEWREGVVEHPGKGWWHIRIDTGALVELPRKLKDFQVRILPDGKPTRANVRR